MKSLPKIIVIIFLIFSFSLAIMLCCCLDETLASTTTSAEHCHHQSNQFDHHKNSHTAHECMCPKMVSDDFSKSFNIQLIAAYFYQEFLKEGAMLVAFFTPPISNHPALLADRSPPSLAKVTIPIYLKISVLRI